MEVKEMREAGMGLSQMQKQLGIHEFRIKKAMSVTEKYSTDRLKHVLSEPMRLMEILNPGSWSRVLRWNFLSRKSDARTEKT